MKKLSARVRKILKDDPFMQKCVWTGSRSDVTWEHCWLYAGSQIDEAWAIVPLSSKLNTSHPPQEVKEYCRWVSLMRATWKELEKYPKKDWEQEKKYLDKKFLGRHFPNLKQ